MSETDPAPTPTNGAPQSGTPDPIPTFAELAADPEIAALLEFEPVPVQPRVNGWDADAQRAFIALLAITGSKARAANAIERNAHGIDQLLKRDDAASFRAAHDAALALFRRRETEKLQQGIAAARYASTRTQTRATDDLEPGEVLNEFGERESEQSFHRRAEEARDSISDKLRRARRLFLKDISDDPAERAAFEILTRLPVDWDKAAQGLPQDDEPWRKPNLRNPDMLLTAEAGWPGEFTHGPDKKAELLKEINAWRAECGLEPVAWLGEGEDPHPCPSPASGRGRNAAQRQEGEGPPRRAPSSSSRT